MNVEIKRCQQQWCSSDYVDGLILTFVIRIMHFKCAYTEIGFLNAGSVVKPISKAFENYGLGRKFKLL